MDKIPYDIIYLLFNTIYYEDTYSLALVNKNYYDIYRKLKTLEKTINFINLTNIKKYVPLGYRYLNINYKIINITQYSKDLVHVILQNGDSITLYFDDKEKNRYNKIKGSQRKYYHIKNIELIIQSPFNIKCKILSGINNNVSKLH